MDSLIVASYISLTATSDWRIRKYYNTMKNIKEYLIYFASMAICLGALAFLFDYCIDDSKSGLHYVSMGLVFGVLSTLWQYLDDKGWNSWKKLFGLFKK